MKKFITLFVILCFSVVCYAEHDYLPFLKQGKKWVTNKYQYLINGDTVVQERTSRTYMKIYQRPITAGDDMDWTYFGCAREKNRKVRIVYCNEFLPTVLYDFNCDAGEEYQNDMPGCSVIIGIYSDFMETEVNGMSRNSAKITKSYKCSREDFASQYKYSYGDQWQEKFIVDWLNNLPADKWVFPTTLFKMIEGIGYINDPFVPGSNDRLVLCEEDGKIIYGTDTSGINSPRLTTNANQDEIYDLQGRRVNNPRQGGIYIQKGKKVKR